MHIQRLGADAFRVEEQPVCRPTVAVGLQDLKHRLAHRLGYGVLIRGRTYESCNELRHVAHRRDRDTTQQRGVHGLEWMIRLLIRGRFGLKCEYPVRYGRGLLGQVGMVHAQRCEDGLLHVLRIRLVGDLAHHVGQQFGPVAFVGGQVTGVAEIAGESPFEKFRGVGIEWRRRTKCLQIEPCTVGGDFADGDLVTEGCRQFEMLQVQVHGIIDALDGAVLDELSNRDRSEHDGDGVQIEPR